MTTAPERLSTYIKVRQHHLRSAHLEHHRGSAHRPISPQGVDLRSSTVSAGL